MEEWVRQLSAMWDDDASYAQLSRAAALHARRPDIQPQTLLSRFIEILQAHAEVGSRSATEQMSWQVSRRAAGWSLAWMVALMT